MLFLQNRIISMLKLFLNNLKMHKISRKIKYFIIYRLNILSSVKLCMRRFIWLDFYKLDSCIERIEPSNLVGQNKVGWRNKEWKKS